MLKKGFIYISIFLLLVSIFPIFIFNIPLVSAQGSGSITAYVDTYTVVYNDWIEVGDSPYLDEGTADRIYTDTLGHAEGKFSFEDIETGVTITGIEMKILAGHAGTSTSNWTINAFTGTSGDPSYFAQFYVTNSTNISASVWGIPMIDNYDTAEEINAIEFSLVNAVSPFGDPAVTVYDAWLEIEGSTPSNDGCVLTNPTDTDDIYAQYITYIATVNASHPSGYTAIVNSTLTIQTGTSTERITFLYDNATDTFSESSGDTTAWELVTGSCVATRSGNYMNLTYYFKAEWDATEESDLDFKVITFDSEGDNDTDTYDLNYDVITTLTVSDFASSPAEYINPSTSVTYSGTVYYVTEPGGSTASTFYPPDAEFTSVIVHDASHTTKGTDLGIANGAFSLSFNSDATVGQDTYHPYTDMLDADYTDGDVSGITDTITVDRLVVTISANVTNPDPDATVNLTLTAIYDYDDNPVTSWTVNSYRNSTHFAAGNFTDNNTVGTLYYYTTENVSETTRGLITFTSNTETIYWSDYVALTIKTIDLDDKILTDTTVYIDDGTEHEIPVDGDGLATLTGIIENTNVTAKVKWQSCWVNGTWTTNMTTTKTIDTPCNVWSFTINAKDAGGTMLSLSPTNLIWLFPNSTEVNQTRVDGSWSFKIMNGTHHYRTQYQGQWVSANVTLPVIDKNVTIINKNCWVYSLTTYVQTTADSPTPYIAITGASLTLLRTSDSTTLNGLYGLSSDFKTTTHNSTHAKYIWTQLANQTSLYTITASVGGAASPKSTSTSLTEDTETSTIQLFYPVGGGNGGTVEDGDEFPEEEPEPEVPENGEEPAPSFPQFPEIHLPGFPEIKIPTFAQLLEDPNVYIPIGIIAALSLIFMVPLIGIRENRKKSKKRKKGLNQDKDGYLPKYKPK